MNDRVSSRSRTTAPRRRLRRRAFRTHPTLPLRERDRAASADEQQRPAARTSRALQSVWNGIRGSGLARDRLLLLLKGVFAASLAWVIADVVLGAAYATFAPFSALLTIRSTVAQSIDQSLRYAGAVLAGVVLAGAVELPLGPGAGTFAILMLLALTIGRLRDFGAQGVQVAVAAAFANAALASTPDTSTGLVQLGWLAGLVVLGCVLGLTTNIAIAPPLRYRDVYSGVSLGVSLLAALLSEMSASLRSGVPAQQTTNEWRDRCEQIPDSIAQVQQSIADAAETMRFNPRLLFTRGTRSFDRFRTIVNTLDRAVGQCISIARGLTNINSGEQPPRAVAERFLWLYSALLDDVTKAIRLLSELPADGHAPEQSSLDIAVAQAWRSCHRLPHLDAEQEDDWPIYTALRIDAHRLTEEIAKAARSFKALREQR